MKWLRSIGVFRATALSAVILGLVTGCILIVQHVSHAKAPDAAVTISKQAPFVSFLPTQGAEAALRPGSIKYSTGDQLLSYVIRYNATNLIVSEQPAPSTFTDVAGYYDKWLASFGEYTSFGSAIGTVHLAKSANINPYPFAILDANGTLVFAKPDHNLSGDDWRRIFNSLRTVKPN